MKIFSVNEKCIGCRACARVAPSNFEMQGKRAVVLRQPEGIEEEELCTDALAACPTEAIESREERRALVTGSSKVVEVLEAHPFLKEDLPELSPRFKTLQNPVMWNSVARFATFNHAAKMTGLSLCEILHFINSRLGLERELFESFPNCIAELDAGGTLVPEETWHGGETISVTSERSLESVITLLDEMPPGNTLTIRTTLPLEPLVAYLDERGLDASGYSDDPDSTVLVIRHAAAATEREIDNGKPEVAKPTGGAATGATALIPTPRFLDVREMREDPFDVILKTAYALKEAEHFTLVQTFRPDPLIRMLEGMGFSHEVLQENHGDVRVLFTKNVGESQDDDESDRPGLTVQSATPVGYPIIMRLLQSRRLREAIRIKDLKVWEETEKHLAWIVNGKADISFSSVITASKFVNMPVRMPVVFVWDNFVLLSRDPSVEKLSHLVGQTVEVPLFEDAPPAKIFRYLMKGSKIDHDDITLEFGTPFGRPREIMRDFLSGAAPHVLLREPEAGFAVAALENAGYTYGEIDFAEIWNDLNPGFGSFPNAGVIVKESLLQEQPEAMQIFNEELREAIDWVNTHRAEAARLSFDMMRSPAAHVERFMERVTFQAVEGDELVSKVRQFYEILRDEEIIAVDVNDQLLDMFRSERE